MPRLTARSSVTEVKKSQSNRLMALHLRRMAFDQLCVGDLAADFLDLAKPSSVEVWTVTDDGDLHRAVLVPSLTMRAASD
jgi:hypothetical protein